MGETFSCGMVNKDEYKDGQYFSAPRVRVQILDTRSSKAVSTFIKQLQYEIMHRNRIDPAVIEIFTDVLPETVLILVCNIGQGGSTKALVEKCLKDVEQIHYKRVILVMVHVMREETLPKLPSSGEVRGEESLKKIGEIVDMGFDDGKIYQWDMNTKAIEHILQFCKAFRYSDNKESQDDNTIVSASNKQTDSIVSPPKPTNHSMNSLTKQTTDTMISPSNQPKDSMDPSSDRETNQHRHEQIESVQENMIYLNRKRYSSKKIYLMTPSNTKALTEFIKIFKTKIRSFGFDIDEKEPSEARNLDPDLLLIVVCNAASRIESDIKSCYDKDLQAVVNDTILIALHVITKGNEPKLPTEDKLAADSIFHDSALVKIIDIAFDTENGMYECTMNTSAEDYFRNFDKV
ncbi:uncharacterized protein LOC132739786 isoform X2 [Ruditapes philippinarum]|uniref:uncharacterized protein LOC132739786 isoform X2 n=1 Tax=Ruditapes philippinarum TaxID=129788 RepID=UPI00295AAAA8|nr:uncharacterized protein LOC132739786 isoform X2 [Ruditapes philippinarum]